MHARRTRNPGPGAFWSSRLWWRTVSQCSQDTNSPKGSSKGKATETGQPSYVGSSWGARGRRPHLLHRRRGPRPLFAELKRLGLEQEGSVHQPRGGAAPGMTEEGASDLRCSIF